MGPKCEKSQDVSQKPKHSGSLNGEIFSIKSRLTSRICTASACAATVTYSFELFDLW